MSYSIELDGTSIPITLRWNASAKRIILRMNPKGQGCIVTLPKGAREKDGLDMVQRHKVWLANQLNRHSDIIPFEDGAMIPLRNIPHTLRHAPDRRRPVWQEGDEIFISGQVDFFNRRLGDWLKKQAREDITPLAHEMAAQIGKKVSRISLRDTVSRWGSCSSSGNLSFNWRLIFAPHEVLKYVVAHEVSHLRYMDHSKDFWATVDLFDVDIKKSRHWLKRNGAIIQKIGT